MTSSLARASRIVTFPAPPILNLSKAHALQEHKEHDQPHDNKAASQPPTFSAAPPSPAPRQPPPPPLVAASPAAVLTLPAPSPPPPAAQAVEAKTSDVAEAVWATEEEEVVVPTRKFGLSLHLSNAETVEDDAVANIRIDGAEPTTPPFSGGGGFKLKLTVASADDDTPQIATSNGSQSAARQPHSASALHFAAHGGGVVCGEC